MLSITHCTYSNTIRQMPQNYCLAVRRGGGEWIMFPDSAADKGIVVALTLSLMVHENKWSTTPTNAIVGMSPYMGIVIPEVKQFSLHSWKVGRNTHFLFQFLYCNIFTLVLI